ncbi:60S ribosomal protein L18 [Myotis davidii]|uniref:60S ribosomal protein L18 n=1 Tax=Myotis davidii TaxID=225400 RepID=L5MCL4_MYODS|nr:60S ribosomal protein L18 [Myotis davidii]
MLMDFHHNKDQKGGAQEPQEPGLLPKAAGQAVQVSCQTYQLYHQPSDAEEVFHDLHQAAACMIWKMKLPGREGKTAVVVGSIPDDVYAGGAQLKVCALHVSSCTGGKILTFSQLALNSKGPSGEKHFSKAPGTPHSHTKPYLCSKSQRTLDFLLPPLRDPRVLPAGPAEPINASPASPASAARENPLTMPAGAMTNPELLTWLGLSISWQCFPVFLLSHKER